MHGVNSSTSACWGNVSRSWPKLVSEDKKFDGFDIFTPEYFTGINSSDYGLSDCSQALLRAMELESDEHGRALLSYKTIILIAHSFGGIVSRHLLDSYRESFVGKRIGLMLMASPSHGSPWANVVRFFTRAIPHRQRDELQLESPILDDLDRRFKRMLAAPNLGFEIVGQEAYEQKRLLGLKKLVSRRSATPYFADPVHIPQSSHSSIVKPDNVEHASHQLLRSFRQKHFSQISQNHQHTQKKDLINCVLFDVYTEECKPYYYSREIDETVSKTAKLKNFWLTGFSGVGKTTIVRHMLGRDLNETINVYLAGCRPPIGASAIKEIDEALQTKANAINEKLSLNHQSTDYIRTCSNNGCLSIFIDEVPVSFNQKDNLQMCDEISHYFHQLRIKYSDLNIKLLLASINDPSPNKLTNQSKFAENFQIIKVPMWTESDLGGLKSLISKSSEIEMSKILSDQNLKGPIDSPRQLKTIIRDRLISQGNV